LVLVFLVRYPVAAGGSWDRFSQAMIELGVNAGLILLIAVAVLIIHRYALGRPGTGEP
jgi:hypothetical protein